MNIENTVIISNHYRRSNFFEQSMTRLFKDGFKNIVIQNTGQGPNSVYRGPAAHFVNYQNSSYDAGMAHFKTLPIDQGDHDVIVLLDNDLFFSGTDLFRDRLEAFSASDLDFSSYFVSPSSYDGRIIKNKYFYEVTDQKFEPSEHYPYFFPEPHWENAFLMIKKSMWKKLTSEDVSHGRLWLKALARENAKMAAHKVSYRGSHSHYADDFFHVGHLFSYYNYVETNQINRFSPDSEFDLQRLGYFAAQERSYGECYHEDFKNSLHAIYNHVGGVERALDAWDKHTLGTVMEGWSSDI